LATDSKRGQTGCVVPRRQGERVRDDPFSTLAEAAMDKKPVAGWTHNFYRYPARFSPGFAAAAIECFSNPSELVLDPYMGGGTTVVEGIAAGRNVIGNDLNSLAAFITRVKIMSLSSTEVIALKHWAGKDVPSFNYYQDVEDLIGFMDPVKTKNLSLARARFIKKAVALEFSDASSFGSWSRDGMLKYRSTASRGLVGGAAEALASSSR
jgi:DNA methylase